MWLLGYLDVLFRLRFRLWSFGSGAGLTERTKSQASSRRRINQDTYTSVMKESGDACRRCKAKLTNEGRC